MTDFRTFNLAVMPRCIIFSIIVLLHSLLLTRRGITVTAGDLTLDAIKAVHMEELKVVLNSRLAALRKYTARRRGECSKINFVELDGVYGQANNNFIQLAHTLWTGSVSNRTVLLPEPMREILSVFDLTEFFSTFCVHFKSDLKIPKRANVLLLRSDFAFGLKDAIFNHDLAIIKLLKLPLYGPLAIWDASRFFVVTYAALWSSPSELLKSRFLDAVVGHLQNSFCYASIHRRSFGGSCSHILHSRIGTDLLAHSLNPQTMSVKARNHHHPSLSSGKSNLIFSNHKIHAHLPLQNPASISLGTSPNVSQLHRSTSPANQTVPHPLCSMNVNFVMKTLAEFRRDFNASRIFLAHDGTEDCSEWLLVGAYTGSHACAIVNSTSFALANPTPAISPGTSTTYPTVILAPPPPISNHIPAILTADEENTNIDAFVDMLIAMHGDFFLLNPYSTFSWTIYVVRAAMGLESAPLLPGMDFYLRKGTVPPHFVDPYPWVSWLSVREIVSSGGGPPQHHTRCSRVEQNTHG